MDDDIAGAPPANKNRHANINRLPWVGAWRKHGWTHLHPIIPPLPVDPARIAHWQRWPGLTETKALDRWKRWHAGKLPGVPDRTHAAWWHPIGVQEANEQLLDELYRAIENPRTQLGADCRRAWRQGAGIGVNGGVWPALDVDVTDRLAARALRDMLVQVFGRKCFIRVGRPPKFLMPFRLPEGEAIHKASLRVSTRQQIEVLGHGVQWVMEGTHGGTGRPYAWHAQAGAGSLGRPSTAELPVIDVAGLETLLAGMAMVLGLAGDRAPQPSVHRVRVVRLADPTGDGAAAAGVPRSVWLRGPEDLAREIMAAWVNDRSVGRDTYVGVAHALIGASTWANEPWGREVFGRWASTHPRANSHEDERVWSTIRAPREGVEWLIARAPVLHAASTRVGWLIRLDQWRRETGIISGNISEQEGSNETWL